ncbi:hypothetical protein FN846DRAFT_123839 [Sphaerosporella brunnea]|uniref:Apple domain-containing protein n=1 Tax=Sphaerosporella brunnea TaxID=1250544 RepID=A0A5J5ES13_9PEZI|nr:hypothetical protein FN846DRAFT_123839 [Sphaerosporella brunnea]
MVAPTTLLSATLLLLSSVVSGTNMDDNTGPVTKAAYNADTHEIDTWRAPAGAADRVKKRYPVQPASYYSYDHQDENLVYLLRSKKQWDFCKAYINLHPVVTKIVTTTACGIRNPKCLPTTVTKVVGVTQDVTDTITAETSTVTLHPTATSTSTVTATVTITSTVGTPLTTTLTPLRKRSYTRPPPFLRGYRDSQISAACSTLVQNVIHTTTVTRTRVLPGKAKTATKTQTRTVATHTILTTVTPAAVTVTGEPVSTATVMETDTVTLTTTICPSATTGVSGIAVAPPGSLHGSNVNDIVGCCSACYNAPGCVGWAFLGAGFCFYGTGSPPNSAPITPQCPFGLGTFTLGTGGPAGLAGGSGPCIAS